MRICWEAIISESQMRHRGDNKATDKRESVFWSAEEGGFIGISENAKFYINENGNPVIVFEKYEIAPGSSGEIEFEIGG